MQNFNLDDLPNIRVRASNRQEMLFVQNALFKAGYVWVGDLPNDLFFDWDYDCIITLEGKIYNENDWGGLIDLTLEQLELLVVEKSLQSDMPIPKNSLPKISPKAKDELYSLIHEEIMKCRIEIHKEMKRLNFDGLESDLIDSMLYKLQTSCPQKAIDYFKD